MINPLAHYFKILANRSNRGNMDLWLAEYYLRRHHWSLAKRHIEQCLAKGDVEDTDRAHDLHQEISLKLHH